MAALAADTLRLVLPLSHLRPSGVTLRYPVVLDLFRRPVVDFPKCESEIGKTIALHAEAAFAHK